MKNKASSRSGVALVIVLGFLVIVSALAVAFFSSVTTELKGARTFASGVTTRQLADSAANLVMAQIRDATARENGAWASQPGMIRVFRDSTTATPSASSKADAFFKLYSSDVMVIEGKEKLKEFVVNPDNEYDPNFNTQPAFWTDLNAPVVLTDPVSGLKTAHYPVIDPTAMGVVQGFKFDPTKVAGSRADDTVDARLPMPVRWIYVLQDGTFTVPDSGSGTVARWTSSTDDKKPTKTNPIVGRIAFWADDDCSKVNINTAAGFVNTTAQVPPGYTSNPSAYMGSYWDTPRYYTNFDYGIPYPDNEPNKALRGMPKLNEASGGLALTQLLQGEYQRYPGHPATTSLGGIFGTYMDSHDLWRILPRISVTNYQASTDFAATSTQMSYGTDGGVKRIIVGPAPGGAKRNNQNLLPKTQRLYASVDELLFAANPGGPFDPKQPAYQRQTNDSQLEQGPPRLTPERLDKLRFFLTASSRAPELNLFGRPRVSVWPVRSERNDETVTSGTLLTTQVPNITPNANIKYYTSNAYTPDGGTGLNSYDKVMLFCSTIGTINWTTAGIRTSEFGGGTPATSAQPGTATGSPGPLPYRYIFFRRNPYLSRDKAAPVALPNPAAQDLLADITLPRNRFLLETYLSSLTSQNIPGFGGNLKAKLDTEGAKNRDALLVEIFDYIRCANMQDTTSLSYPPLPNPPIKNRNFAPRGLMAPSKIEFVNPPVGYPSQARDGVATSMGLGRFPTIHEVSLVFYYAGPTWQFTDGSAAGAPPASVYAPKCEPIIQTTGTEVGRPKFRQMRAFLLISTFNPMFGYSPMANPASGEHRITYEVTGLENFTVTIASGTYNLGFPAQNSQGRNLNNRLDVSAGAVHTGRNMGGYEGFMHTLIGGSKYGPKTKIAPGPSGAASTTDLATHLPVAFYGGNPARLNPTSITATSNNTVPAAPTPQEYYEFQTRLFPVGTFPGADINQNARGQDVGTGICIPIEESTFNFNGGPITIKVWYDEYDDKVAARPTTLNGMPYTPVQTFEMTFENDTGWPIPKGDEPKDGSPDGRKNCFNPETNKSIGQQMYYWTGTGSFWPDAVRGNGVPAPDTNFNSNIFWYQFHDKANQTRVLEDPTRHPALAVPAMVTVPKLPSGAVPLRCGVEPAWSLASRINWARQTSDAADRLPHPTDNEKLGPPVNWFGDRWRCIVQPYDTVRSMIYCETPTGPTMTSSGDLRVGLLSTLNTQFRKHPDYEDGGTLHACNLRAANGNVYFVDRSGGNPGPWTTTDGTRLGNLVDPGAGKYMDTARSPANLPRSRLNTAAIKGVVQEGTGAEADRLGDFDQGIGNFADGPYANKPDEGNVVYAWLDTQTGLWHYPIPYFTSTWAYEAPGDTFTSPLRQMPSPAMIGSLPRRPASLKPWETLCFTPYPSSRNHPGNADPKDHLILDLFTMPIVEPYPISEPFSTAGKINLNYQIAPFNYITRSTALRAALAPIRVTGVNTEFYNRYKTGENGTRLLVNFRNALDANKPVDSPSDLNAESKTLKGFEDFFDAAKNQANPDLGIFKSASQICEMALWPLGSESIANIQTNFWDGRLLTGDNVREKPYADLYPRLTTKSNTYTVHFRVQTLRQVPRDATGNPNAYAIWEEGKDGVLGEYRGSTTIERYIDPSDTRLNKWLPGGATPNPDYINPDITLFDPTQNPATPTSPANPTRSLELIYRFRTVMNKKFAP